MNTLFDFSKRINGKSYYIRFFLSTICISLLAGGLDSLPNGSKVATILAWPFLVTVVVYAVYILCVTRQRANDIGWHPLLLTLLAFGFAPAMLVLGLVPAQKSANRYGPVIH